MFNDASAYVADCLTGTMQQDVVRSAIRVVSQRQLFVGVIDVPLRPSTKERIARQQLSVAVIYHTLHHK